MTQLISSSVVRGGYWALQLGTVHMCVCVLSVNRFQYAIIIYAGDLLGLKTPVAQI